MKEDLESIKDTVADILQKYPETRNSDHDLELRYLLETGLAEKRNGGIYISFQNYRKKCLATVRRFRRKFQEEGYYLPVDEVDKARVERELQFRAEFSPNVEWSPSPSDGDFNQKRLFYEER